MYNKNKLDSENDFSFLGKKRNNELEYKKIIIIKIQKIVMNIFLIYIKIFLDLIELILYLKKDKKF